MSDFLRFTEHRPWPMPRRPWLWRQRWDQVLLLHFRIAADRLRPHVPQDLALDLYDASAWVSVVPFRMRAVRPRGFLEVGPLSNFVELNVRTYVTARGRPGVYFLRITAGSPTCAWLGRMLSPLPYQYEPLSWRAQGAGVHFEAAGLAVEFSPGAPLETRGATDRWLMERYCLYADSQGGLSRAEVHHLPWPLVVPRVRIHRNRLLCHLEPADPLVPDAVHLSPGVEVVAWTAERLERTRPTDRGP